MQVHQWSIQDQETILMKFLDIKIVEDLYAQLKSVWSCLVRKKTTINGNVDDKYNVMLKDVVDCLFQEGKVKVKTHREPFLLLGDVDIVM